MILVDANLLIYAAVESMPQHQAAHRWLDEKLTGNHPVGLPWPSLLAFLRLVTNPRIFEHYASIQEAWAGVSAWLENDNAWIPMPGERHRAILGDLLEKGQGTANLVPDAHIAALAIEHGLELCSTDHHFARFPGLRWRDPLA